MLIRCANKLLDEWKGAPVNEVGERNPEAAWHGNVLKVDRNTFTVLVNDQNRYSPVLYG
ncbi:hypothetical protein SLH55_11890 [Rossellomorea sp. YZS02]|nr:hypothetical protein [Rossellomorea sp. YZS02]MDX8344177.1 hypothetical protein [Rossellomorea sp. YZS02]